LSATPLIALRLAKPLLDEVDAYAKKRQAELPALKVSRSDAIRELLMTALAAVKVEPDAGPPAKPSKARISGR
jgi:hypothetical protein